MKMISVEENEQKIYKFFDEAERELISQNRFSNKKLDSIVDYLISCRINEGHLLTNEMLYRARIYDEYDAEEKYKDNSDKTFKGYDERNSYVNLSNNVVDGRCNPFGISYLYASSSRDCCIHEIRPSIGSYVNVASIQVCRGMKIFALSINAIGGFNASQYKKEIIPGINNGVTCLYLIDLFKRPYQYRRDYLITQYISEKLKNNGFDGISYLSSLYKGEKNTNYVIFSYEKCRPIDSKLYKITGNQITYESNENNSKDTLTE